jgi:hypothetical protein
MIFSSRGLAAATALCRLAAPLAARALPLISELYYDAVGTDDGQSFVELYGLPGTDLTGLLVQGINGTGGTVTDTIALSGVIPADGLFVIADGFTDGTTPSPTRTRSPTSTSRTVPTRSCCARPI